MRGPVGLPSFPDNVAQKVAKNRMPGIVAQFPSPQEASPAGVRAYRLAVGLNGRSVDFNPRDAARPERVGLCPLAI